MYLYAVSFFGHRQIDNMLVASAVRRCKRTIRDDNSALVLVLPYATAEYRNNEQAFYEYYDEIEICLESAEKHFKSAHQVRNRSILTKSETGPWLTGRIWLFSA